MRLLLTSMLLLLACQSDPLLLPGLEPAIEGKVTATLHTGTVEQGTPMWLDATMAGPRVRGEQLIVTSAGGRDGRGSWDEWIVVPADGVTDPSPYWEDQQHGGARSHGFAGPEKTVDLKVALGESVRFPKPGRYGVQWTTVRGVERVRSAPVAITVRASTPPTLEALLQRLEGTQGAARSQAFIDVALAGSDAMIPYAIERLDALTDATYWSMVLHLHPDRAKVQQALDAAIANPDAKVPAAMMETRAALCYNAEYAWPQRLPVAVDTDMERFRLERQVRDQFMQGCRAQAAQQLVQQVPTKIGPAKGSALATLMQVRVDLVEDPPWGPEVGSLAAASLDLLDEESLNRWLSTPRYWDAIDHTAALPDLAQIADAEATMNTDLALVRLAELAPDQGLALAAKRYDRARPAATADAERLLSRTVPTREQVAALTTKLDGADARTLRIAAAHATPAEAPRWTELYQRLPPDPSGEVLGAVAAGLMNSGSPLATEALDRFGPDFPQLLLTAGIAARDKAPLVARAMFGMRLDEPTVSIASGHVIAEYGGDREIRAVIGIAPVLPSHAEMGAMVAIGSGRNWMVDQAMYDRLLPTIENVNALGVAKELAPADQDILVIEAFYEVGLPAIRFSLREYVGEAAILTKLKQMRPGRGVKFTYDGLSATTYQAEFEGYAKKAGLPIVARAEK